MSPKSAGKSNSLYQRYSAALQVMKGARDCKLCKKINALLKKEMDTHAETDLGLVDDLLAFDCPQHKQLFDWLSTELKFQEHRGTLIMRRDYFSSSTTFDHSSLENSNEPFSYATVPLDVEKCEDNESFGFGVRLDPQWIDKNMPHQWYSDCCLNHKKCSSPDFLTQIPAPKPQYFIDTLEMCLTLAPQDVSFVALSYVWGKVNMIKTTKANLSQLQRPGALNDTDLQPLIPLTVRHAIHLLPFLGERYLWVDILSIVQDDEGTFKDQLSRMASIFAHATAVIAALDGPDADYGLRGWKGLPSEEQRHVEQFSIPFDNKTLIRRMQFGQNSKSKLGDRTYFRRAWTFQEYLFARRRICFQNDCVWFQCCESTHYEDHARSELPWDRRDWTFEVGYPALNVYSDLVQDFNARQLSYAEDCLSAFTGLLSCYTKAFKGGFLCGLPEIFFDAALLWQPNGELTRRVPSGNTQHPTATEACLPSWSWIGWAGDVNFDNWATGNDWVAACRGLIATSKCQTFPMTQWYTSDSLKATERRHIDVEWFTWRNLYQDPTRQLPPGWKRSRKKPNEILTIEDYPDGYGKYLYQHKSCSATFWYPMPLFDPSPQPKLNPHTRYLFASVQTAQLYPMGAAFMKQGSDLFGRGYSKRYISLCDSKKQWVGILRLHNHEQFKEDEQGAMEARTTLQLVVLSRGTIPNNLGGDAGPFYMDEYNLEQRPNQGGLTNTIMSCGSLGIKKLHVARR
ncbi:heterokaryon incompatibility protein-domain-containing protein [Phaeosphaeriaceae sp. PMI808]|nr:heterokaryon incompatibility protein-domain-containing protein [Phaeosphaeriaceae sp. PMI808]